MTTSLTSQCSIRNFPGVTLQPDNFVTWLCFNTSSKNGSSPVWTKAHLDLVLNLGFHTLRRDIDQSEGDQEGSRVTR